MYTVFVDTHIVLSSLFFIVAFILVLRSIYKLSNKKSYRRSDKRLTMYFLVFLYMQFITGVILYFFIRPDVTQQPMTMEEFTENSKFRFWVAEHLATMIFALMLSQIGWFLVKNASSDRSKFRSTIFYFGISLVIIVLSTSIALIKEGIF